MANGWPNRLLFHINTNFLENLCREIGYDREESLVFYCGENGGSGGSGRLSRKVVGEKTGKSDGGDLGGRGGERG